MQPVADLRFLEIAEIGVELLQIGFVIAASSPHRGRAGSSRVRSRMSRFSEAMRRAVEPEGEIILIDQRLEVLERPVGLGARQRRRQMIDDHRRRSAAWPACPRRDR